MRHGTYTQLFIIFFQQHLIIKFKRRNIPCLHLLNAEVALAVAVGAYPVVRGLGRRLERLKDGVEQLGSGDLGARVKVEGRDEVAALAASFNRSAERIEELIAAHRLLLANCSHELRTPLARIAVAASLLGEQADAKTREALKHDIAELDQLIEEILLASRLEALPGLERHEPVDLLALAAEEAAHYDLEASGAAGHRRRATACCCAA